MTASRDALAVMLGLLGSQKEPLQAESLIGVFRCASIYMTLYKLRARGLVDVHVAPDGKSRLWSLTVDGWAERARRAA